MTSRRPPIVGIPAVLWAIGVRRGVRQWTFWPPFVTILAAAGIAGTLAAWIACVRAGGGSPTTSALGLLAGELAMLALAVLFFVFTRRRTASDGAPERDDALPPLSAPRTYALGLLATVLGGGMSSRLFTEVRERRGLAYYVYAHQQGYTDTGTLYSQAGVDIQRIDDAVRTVVGEFRRIADKPIEADELEKARNFAKGHLILSLEDPKGMILFGLRYEVLEGTLREPDEVLAGLDTVTIEDVQRVAQDVIRDDRLNFALIGPFDDPARFENLLADSA